MLPETLILPPRTVAGAATITRLLAECAEFGDRALLVHGRSLESHRVLDRILADRRDPLTVTTWCHPGGEPTLEQLEDLLSVAREHGINCVAAVGGGSVLDIGKACAGLLHAPLPVVEYHDGAPIERTRIGFVAAPTTAGTGSEATIVSVLTNAGRGVKKSIRHPSFMARTVILDPELLATCPPHVIASSGMDAFTQAVESLTSIHATRFTEQLSLEAMRLIALAIEPVYKGARGNELSNLLFGSYLAGLALSNARLGIVHGLAHPLGVRYHQPHGLVCAVCLPHALEFNREAIGAKYDTMSRVLGSDLQALTEHLMAVLDINSPFVGVSMPDREDVINETLASGSTRANPRPVTAADVDQLLDIILSNH